MSHRVTYFFFHSLFNDLPLRFSNMPWEEQGTKYKLIKSCVDFKKF